MLPNLTLQLVFYSRQLALLLEARFFMQLHPEVEYKSRQNQEINSTDEGYS